MDWMHLAQDSDQWWALVNTVMNLWIPQKVPEHHHLLLLPPPPLPLALLLLCSVELIS